ncbi:hypothetical protein LTR09_006139 [Extremus antarcticus]|uniref:Uncharacterized protein n=1 Tax=Extremus antarcticus TaxID=702011 RepID=A0AAJ0DF46_9PEZI|nr:hypothetical protein LTR09_006139 [Extremus antarcticus]
MAGYSHTRAGSRTSVGPGEELPSGSCNYRDISTTSQAPVCGCTKFWLNVCHFNVNDGGVERAWCFCGHHACFHNAFSQQQEQEQVLASSRVIAAQGLGIRPDSRSQSQSINTRVFQALNEFARLQEDGEQASDTNSKLPSTTAPSLVEEPWHASERWLQQGQQNLGPMPPPVVIPTGSRITEDYSATEVATPSIAGTPDFRALAASSSSGNRPSPGHLQPGNLQRPRIEPPRLTSNERTANVEGPAPVRNTTPDLQNILQTYGRRLDILETLSFSHVPVEELQDRFEHFDGRILDLEQWRVDQDQREPAPDHIRSTHARERRMLPAEASSFDSDESFDMNAAAHAEAVVLATLAANAETHPRIDALESRVQELEQTALPSFARPWRVQVVLLPWGRDLKGIWFSATEATRRSTMANTQLTEEWTGAQSGPNLSFNSASGAWTTESIQAWAKEAQEWLSPKACGPSGAVFQRLASRGLVRDMTLRESDARHIANMIDSTFGELGIGGKDVSGAEETRRYQALQQSLIPLRKVRKSARLRFLSPAEMVTSASWTASFLDSSVFMKVGDGQRRLYITTPEAYSQPNTNDVWSWKRLRGLTAFEATAGEQAARTENVAIEACWSYNERLDRSDSLHSSFATRDSQWSTRSQFAVDDPDDMDDNPMQSQPQLRPQRQRTASLPESSEAAGQAKAALPKRRVASFEPVPSVNSHSDERVEINPKRRRITVSPEAERRGVNFTPRWSREPPSPFTSEPAVEARSQGASSSRKRGTTPFAYATPHSNSNFVGRVELASGDGDTEVATDIVEREEEWEGVEEGLTNLDDSESVDDNEDLEDGLSLYED